MERAVYDVHRGGEVERAGQLRGNARGVRGRRRSVLADGDIQRLRLDVLVHKVHRRIDDAGGERRVDRGMDQRGGDQPLEFAEELLCARRRQIEGEEFDRDRAAMRRIVRAKNRSQRSRADLMKNLKRSERGRKPGANSFRAQ